MAHVSPARPPGSWLRLQCHCVTGHWTWQAGGSRARPPSVRRQPGSPLGTEGLRLSVEEGAAQGPLPAGGSACLPGLWLLPPPQGPKGPRQRLGCLRALCDSAPRQQKPRHRPHRCDLCLLVRARAGSAGGSTRLEAGSVLGGGATLVEAGQAAQGGVGSPPLETGRARSAAVSALGWAGALAGPGRGRVGAGRSRRAGAVGGRRSAGAAPQSGETALHAGLQVT